MLLAIDIGNTNISFGIFSGSKIVKKFEIPTKYYSLQNLTRSLPRASIDDAVICSVVPAKTPLLEKGLKTLLGKRPFIIGKDLLVPIRNLYRKPAQVGQDRLVNAYAGVRLYGAPLIVVDFGTAVTFDVISRNKEYQGGMILPGLQISLRALYENTALLPKIGLKKPKGLIGQDTQSSMLSGIVYGFASLTDNLIAKIKGQIGSKAKAVATGGNINLMAAYCKQIDKIDRVLTLKGLNLVYKTKEQKNT